MYKRLENIKETLLCAVEAQMLDLECVDTKELGEAIDMLKDLEEAMYYCTVIKAMKDPEEEWEWEHEGEKKKYPHSRRGWDMKRIREHEMEGDEYDYDDSEHRTSHHDMREGRSYNSRRMYMEAKEMQRDKASQLKELEKYMQELSQDIMEMITDASPEERQYLEKKMTTLAAKVGQIK